MYGELKKIHAALEESQKLARVIETWAKVHQGEPIANLFGSFVKQQVALNEALAAGLENLFEFGPKQHKCSKCGGQADHYYGGWYCHTHLAEWIG